MQKYLVLTGSILLFSCSKKTETIKTYHIPMLALRGVTLFPQTLFHFDVGRQKSVKALEQAMTSRQRIFLVTQTRNCLSVYHLNPLDERRVSNAFRWRLPTATAIRKRPILRSAAPFARVARKPSSLAPGAYAGASRFRRGRRPGGAC